jgi:sulfate adenylyltransferase
MGGRLVSLVAPPEQQDELKAAAAKLPSIELSERSACDLKLLACGAFSPLDHFVTREEHESIVEEMRLPSGHLFPIPLPLPASAGPALHLDREACRGAATN